MSEGYPLAKRKKPLEGEVVETDKFRGLGEWLRTSCAEGAVLLYTGSKPLYQPPAYVDSTARLIEE